MRPRLKQSACVVMALSGAILLLGAKRPAVDPRVEVIAAAALEPDLVALVGKPRHQEAEPAALAAAAKHIEKRFGSMGYATRRQAFGTGLNAGVNVIARREGRTK